MRVLFPMLAFVGLVATAGPVRAQALIVDATRPRAADSTRTTVVVDNQRFDEATVYLVLGGTSVELGVAHSMTHTSFSIPRSQIGQRSTIHFVIRPIGNPSLFSSRDVTVEPGDHVDLTIPTI